MTFDFARVRVSLKSFDFQAIFLEELGWDHHDPPPLVASVDEVAFTLDAFAEKRGMVAYLCSPDPMGQIPSRAIRQKIERFAAKHAHEHIIIYLDGQRTTQIWQWVKRELGKPAACREHTLHKNQPGDSLIQKLQLIAFSISEEESLTIIQVAGRAKIAFDVDHLTKRFYERFRIEHGSLMKSIDGIPDRTDREWYTSLILNRLMFTYFIQKKGFLDGDVSYLRNRLQMIRSRKGKNQFLSFYRHFLLRLFHEGLARRARPSDLDELLGRVPYLNGGLFEIHELERKYADIQIPDEAFQRVFSFFDSYQWHLDERLLRSDNQINPDVLGYIFEKYVNQKQMGAYYSKEDITEYISKFTVLPRLFETAREKCAEAFEGHGRPTVWDLLAADPDRYIPFSVRHGISWDIHSRTPLHKARDLPPDVAIGIKPPTLHRAIADGPVQSLELRKGWNKGAPSDYALPTETWREVVARRTRYEEVRNKLVAGEVHDINDLITLNLDISQFAQDAIETTENPELLRAFWRSLEGVTILDPTCGSGAFLFAALNVLEPLYEACLDRMEVFIEEVDRSSEKYRPENVSDFHDILGRVATHPNRRYFIFKSIILRNLFGVDIMEEAVEICKLRLFLKLAAQVEPDATQENLGIEPLPDIDFNIKAGNTLVGFAKYEDARRAIRSNLDLDDAMTRISVKAADLQQAFDAFRQGQVDGTALPGTNQKMELRSRLFALQDELNRYLYAVEGVEPAKKEDYSKWLKSHGPFHWFVEFYGIVKDGGFDVIIGNPPYVEYAKVSSSYKVKELSTVDCGNIYAPVMEQAFGLLKSDGAFGMIVPMSLCSGKRFQPLRDLTFDSVSPVYISNYEIFPSKLFEGSFQRLTIVVGRLNLNGERKRAITKIRRWYSVERNSLIETTTYSPSPDTQRGALYAKISSPIQYQVFRTVASKSNGTTLAGALAPHKSKAFVFYQEATNYWTKASTRLPFYKKNGVVTTPAHGRTIYLDRPKDALITSAIMNSSLFYVWFVTYSDGFHLSDGLVTSFPCDISLFNDNRLLQLAKRIEARIAETSKEGTRNTAAGDMIEIEEFRMNTCKDLLNDVDRLLAQHYGFTEEELDYIINYDIKYRMGRDAQDGDE